MLSCLEELGGDSGRVSGKAHTLTTHTHLLFYREAQRRSAQVGIVGNAGPPNKQKMSRQMMNTNWCIQFVGLAGYSSGTTAQLFGIIVAIPASIIVS